MRCGGGSWSFSWFWGFALCAGCSSQGAASPSNDAAAATDSTMVSPDSGDAGDAGPVQCSDFNALKNPYWGDLHLHTAFSLDAYGFGTRNMPLDAYAFARGQALQIAAANGGPMTQIDRPLDFLAVTDHSEWLAATYGCGDSVDGGAYDDASPYYDSPTCSTIRTTDPATQEYIFTHIKELVSALCEAGTDCTPIVRSAWQAEQSAAAAAYDPCHFTSFVAYEWTSVALDALGAHHQHRNVVFANDHVVAQPLTANEYPAPSDLWNALEGACTTQDGCTAITIPHNSNLSNGHTFEIPDAAANVDLMAKYQVLAEVFQIKGNSECYYDPANAATYDCWFEHIPSSYAPNNPAGAVRSALTAGLIHATKRTAGAGKDPLQLGFVGDTDSHGAMPGNVKESSWQGTLNTDDTPAKRLNGANFFNPGGITGVWAEQNTRDSLFAAFQRRETFATSGPRIVVRFYQAWSPGDPCNDPSFPQGILRAGGVPMGSTFSPAPADAGSAAPSFVVYAWKDADPLERIDIIKGWVDANGQPHEQLFYNAVTPGSSGSACLVWQDPGFTGTPSYYYARVVQAPTWRWSHYDCLADPSANPAGCAPGGGLDVMIRERAWTSPIWFLP